MAVESSTTEISRSRTTDARVIESIIGITLTITALLGNSLVLIAAYRNPRLRKCPYLYFVFLAVTDIVMAAFPMPLTSYAVITGKWDIGEISCKIQGFVIHCCGMESVMIFGLIAVCRYCKMIRPDLYSRVITNKFVVISVVGTTLIFCATMAFVIQYNGVYFHMGYNACCLKFSTLVFAILLTLTATLYALQCFCYFKIWRFINSHNYAMQNSAVRTKELKTTRTLFLIVIAFTLSFVPLFISALIESAKGFYSLPIGVYMFSSVMIGVASCVNPMIYTVMSNVFRKEFTKILCTERCRKRRRVMPWL